MAKTNKGNTMPDFAQSVPNPEADKKDEFIKDLTEGVANPFDNFEEPEGQAVVVGSTFWLWRDENDVPYIGKVFVGQYIGEHPNPDKDDFTKPIIGYDFKGYDGNDYILGDNYSLKQALHEVSKDGVNMIKELQPRPWLWIKLLSVDESKKGEFNRFKIVVMDKPPVKK